VTLLEDSVVPVVGTLAGALELEPELDPDEPELGFCVVPPVSVVWICPVEPVFVLV
jgi:hypothetical protein